MFRWSRLAWLGIAATPFWGAAQAQTPPNQELAGTARRPPVMRPAIAETSAEAGDLCVPFRTGSASLTPTATRELDALIRRVASRSTLRVEGFGDTPEASDADRDLARRRADAVARYLATLGLDRVQVAVLDQAAPYSRRVKVKQESK